MNNYSKLFTYFFIIPTHPDGEKEFRFLILVVNIENLEYKYLIDPPLFVGILQSIKKILVSNLDRCARSAYFSV